MSYYNENNVEVSSSNEVSNQHKKTKYNNTHRGNVEEGIRVAICKVEIVKGKKCGTKYKISTSTSNCATHLNNVHGITKEQAKNNLVSLNIPHNKSRQLELYQYLVDWIVSDFQPLTILQNKAFRKFITELDSKFQIPNAKHIKKLIYRAYNYSFPLIIEKLKNEATSLREITLSVEYIHYPHIAENIGDNILSLLDESELRDKNSSYLAWCRLLELKGYIRILKANLAENNNRDSKKDFQQLNRIMLTNDEWDLLRDLIPVLGSFEEVTRYLGSSSYATYSIVSPLMSEIIKRLKPASLIDEINIEKIQDIFIAIDEDTNQQEGTNLDKPIQSSNAIERVKETLYRAIYFYWKNDIISYLLSILDPRVKKIDFVPDKVDE
ncbi:31306_t:CDS:2, partial [Gigaspora margarita]